MRTSANQTFPGFYGMIVVLLLSKDMFVNASV